MVRRIPFSVGLYFLALFLPFAQAFSISDTFTVELNLNLCGEYQLGGVSVEFSYTVGTDTQPQRARLVSKKINASDNTGRFKISLPSFYGVLPLNVFAQCVNNYGAGTRSNVLAVTNCDALAILDTDADGIANNVEDKNCDNFYSPGDLSNPDNVDTDGDGVRDLVELVSLTDPNNPGSSPRPMVATSAPFDPDGDGKSNPVVWRSSAGSWYVKDYTANGNTLSIPLGVIGDIPFAYQPAGLTSNVGVIRNVGNRYQWFFYGPGFLRRNGVRETTVTFGIFGDNIIPGPWEIEGVTNPAVARLFNNAWTFEIYLSDGNVRRVVWGGNGDVPKVSDYDGDGLFDIAVYRPSSQQLFVIYSSSNDIETFEFGSGTADFTFRGDITGDGTDDISFWEPTTSLFTSMRSDNGFNDAEAQAENPVFYQELPLGTYFIDVPLSWNRQNNRILYTVVNHSTGVRTYRPKNSRKVPAVSVQWGLNGDAQG